MTRDGRPLPVEYLLVQIPVSMPITPNFTFYADGSKKAFPIENRIFLGELQNPETSVDYLGQFGLDHLRPEQIFDLHFLLYLLCSELVRFEIDDLRQFCKHMVKEELNEAMTELMTSEKWNNFAAIVLANAR